MSVLWQIYQVIAFLIISFATATNDDEFENIKRIIDRTTAENCGNLNESDLHLTYDAVSHLPDATKFLIEFIHPNRTALLHLHNMALSRSYFWSFIMQSRFFHQSKDKEIDPGLIYYWLATAADIASNPYLYSSAVYSPKESNSEYIHKALSRYGPRSFKRDNVASTSTFHFRNVGENGWLPDSFSDDPTQYMVTIRYANNDNKTFLFYGPPDGYEKNPVKFTRPFFDCGQSNKWLVAAFSPAVDVDEPPRLSENSKDAHARYVAATFMEIEFEKIDINQCPTGDGNNTPNKYANTAKCKKETTECQPIDGKGFHRNGYQCRCRVGFHLPSNTTKAFTSDEIEKATSDQYKQNFDCIAIINPKKVPFYWDKSTLPPLDELLENHTLYSSEASTLKLNVTKFFDFFTSVNRKNCKNFRVEDLQLHQDFAYGVRDQFTSEMHMALRLANFISTFLQLSGRELTEEELFGEVLALVMGRSIIGKAGIYWNENKYKNHTLFAPLAYLKQFGTRRFNIDDLARLEPTDHTWFKELKQLFSNNPTSDEFDINLNITLNEREEVGVDQGASSYRGTNVNAGVWSTPSFDCGGVVEDWFVTYAVPFFGWTESKSNLELKGAVAISIRYVYLDVNQCDDTANLSAFKGTHKCDKETSYCVPERGYYLFSGGYRCECLPGYEYPYDDYTTYFSGSLMEAEFQNAVINTYSRYDQLKCRPIETSNRYL